MAAARSNKGAARWLADLQCGVVTQAVGKYLNTMGYRDDGQKLFVEEVVFLVDCDELDVYCSLESLDKEEPMSKVSVFALLESADIDMKVYTIYSILREQRFHVYRHGASRTPIKDWKNLPHPRVAGIPYSADDGVKRVRMETRLTIAFDVYRPQANFAKNNLGRPDFCVAIISADEMLPSLSCLLAAMKNLPANVPLRLGVVGDSSVTFVDVSEFDVAQSADPQGDDAAAMADGKAS